MQTLVGRGRFFLPSGVKDELRKKKKKSERESTQKNACRRIGEKQGHTPRESNLRERSRDGTSFAART